MAPSFEQLRDRWERLAPRERRLVALLGVTFVVFVLAWVSFIIQSGLGGISSRNDQAREALSALQDYRAAEAARAAGGGPDVVIPDEAIELESYLEGIANQTGVSIPSYGSQRPEEVGDYTEVSTKIEIEGISIYELKDFLQQIETKSKLVVIKSLHVEQSFRDEEKLDVDMVVATYERRAKGSDKGDG
jgi:type II secretory pathway component PulM